MPSVKKCLFVISPYPVYPVADGAGRRIDGICRLLLEKGFEVFLFAPRLEEAPNGTASTARGMHLVSYARKRNHNYFFNSDLTRVLKKHMGEKPELIILHFPYLAAALYRVARKHNIPVHLDEHNVEYQRFKNMGRPFVTVLIYFAERYAVKNARSVSVTSRRDAAIVETKFGRTSTVIENFIDTERFFPISEAEKVEMKKSLGMDFPKIVCYFGNFTNVSTKQAYGIISEKIAPGLMREDPQIKIAVIGKGLKREKPPVTNMVIVGQVERIAPYIQLSDMVMVPLVSGGGTRYKILEALGCGIPVLSTPKGNEGLDLGEKDGVIVADVEAFPEKIAAFFSNRSGPEKFRPNRQYILNRYSLSGIAQEIDFQKTFGLTGIQTS